MTRRKSSTVVLLACSPLAPLLLPGGGRITIAAVGSGKGVVVNRLRSFPVVLLAEEGDVVDAGGAGGVVAAAGVFRAGLGVGVPGDVMRGRGPGVLTVAPDEQDGQVEWVLCRPGHHPDHGSSALVRQWRARNFIGIILGISLYVVAR